MSVSVTIFKMLHLKFTSFDLYQSSFKRKVVSYKYYYNLLDDFVHFPHCLSLF